MVLIASLTLVRILAPRGAAARRGAPRPARSPGGLAVTTSDPTPGAETTTAGPAEEPAVT